MARRIQPIRVQAGLTMKSACSIFEASRGVSMSDG
jgi:hypothetical protein